MLALPVLLAVHVPYARAQDPMTQPAAAPLRPPGLVARDPALRGQYLAPLLRLRAGEGAYLDNARFRQQYLGISAVYETFVGRYAHALASMDRIRPPREDTAASAALPVGARAHPAVEAIVREGRGRRAVFLNEAHHAPQHRAFGIMLLRALRAEGFNVFAAEMISPEDTGLVRRGYPAVGRTGIYTDEPLGGELVREAFRLGFRVVAYDGPFPCEEREDDPLFCANERERMQAEALAAVLAEDPAARLVVYAGFGHVHEDASGDWIPMAVRFRTLAGTDPLTIDQTVMSEHSSPEFEPSMYRDAAARELVREPVVFRGADGVWVVSGAPVDLQVFHPRTRLVRGRPQWMPAGRRRVSVPLPAHGGTMLVQAFHAGEGPDAVPADQVLVEPGTPAPSLALAPGEYRISVLGEAGPLTPDRRVRVDARGRVRALAAAPSR